MSQAIVKDLRKDLAALAKRQEVFEDKILSGTLAKDDADYFKNMALYYADECKKIRAKLMEMLSELGDVADVAVSDAPTA